MADKQITLIVKIKSKPGLEDKVKTELTAMLAPTHAEAGCINYVLHQARDDKGLFFFYETWASQQHLDEHMQTPHLKNLLAKANDLFAEPIEGTFVKVIS